MVLLRNCIRQYGLITTSLRWRDVTWCESRSATRSDITRFPIFFSPLDDGKSHITFSCLSMYGKNWLRYSLICFRWRRKKTPQTTARMIKINTTPPATPMAIMISDFRPCGGGSDGKASDTERKENNPSCFFMLLQLGTDHIFISPK